MSTFHRREAAAWLGIDESIIRHWEKRRVLQGQRPGVRRPATYGVADLVVLHILVELRQSGTDLAVLRRVRLALDEIDPPIHTWPARVRLLVTADGEVARIGGSKELSGRTREGGTFSLFEPRRLTREAEKAVTTGRA